MMPVSIVGNVVFESAIEDIRSLGFQFSSSPFPGAATYVVVGGRSNQRWWLIPLGTRQIVESGLALFQPVSIIARLAKALARLSSRVGLLSALPFQKIYCSNSSILSGVFGDISLRFSFFTGTDCFHRKATIQVMNSAGKLLGFAKVTRAPAVGKVIQHEHEMLRHLSQFDFGSLLIPKIRYFSAEFDSTTLVTDTIKTPTSGHGIEFTEHHRHCLEEIARKTATSDGVHHCELLLTMHKEYASILDLLDPIQKETLDISLRDVGNFLTQYRRTVFSHGDFTPWNSFRVGEQIYVFDLEYASSCGLPGSDYFHFVISTLLAQGKRDSSALLKLLQDEPSSSWIDEDPGSRQGLLTSYLLRSFLFLAARARSETADWLSSEHASIRVSMLKCLAQKSQARVLRVGCRSTPEAPL